MKMMKRLVLATVVGTALMVSAAPTFAASQNGTNQNNNPQQHCQNGTIDPLTGACINKQNG